MSRVLPSPRPPDFDVSDQFALGGNGLAALYSVADDREAARLFATAEDRSRQARVATVATVLLPSFPSGFFLHPIQKDEYTYQNGGQWDWWAGRFLLAEFNRGASEASHRQLREIAARVSSAGGLYEWNTRTGRGQGSARYAGSAGALSGAIFQGLFGIDSRAQSLAVTVRLGASPGAVRTYEPAIDRYVAYRHEPDPGGRKLRLTFESNAPGSGELRIRLPPDAGGLEGAWLDDRPWTVSEEVLGRDRYVRLQTDWRRHVVRVKWRL
jgi:hypothetical protein